jgi:hypothetical protein
MPNPTSIVRNILGDRKSKDNVSQQYMNKQIEIGMKVEAEHTKNKVMQKKIAMDHLKENPYYYEYLIRMEKQMMKDKRLKK